MKDLLYKFNKGDDWEIRVYNDVTRKIIDLDVKPSNIYNCFSILSHYRPDHYDFSDTFIATYDQVPETDEEWDVLLERFIPHLELKVMEVESERGSDWDDYNDDNDDNDDDDLD